MPFSLKRLISGINRPSYISDDIARLESILGIRIRNKKIFEEALTHRSYVPLLRDGENRSNERLEFLGDAVLNLAAAEFLYRKFPTLEEGEMTRLRSFLVNQHSLADYARKINLLPLLRMTASAQQAVEKGYESLLADAFESLLAAMYLDSGFNKVMKFLYTEIFPRDISSETELFMEMDRNFKSALLELTQANGLGIPKYNLLKEEGPDHDRTFTVQVIVNDIPRGTGVGKTKKSAEQAAAEVAYRQIKKDLEEKPRSETSP
ncbi:MAG: ribonuclease III [Candidatus Kryptoniota bacterium]